MTSGWSFSRLSRTFSSLALAAIAAGGISAHAAQLTVLVDQDLNASTGCSVTTASGAFAGVEQKFVTTIDTSVNPPMVTGVTQATCTNASTNTFGAPTSVSAGGWSVGVGNGVAGYNVIETGLPLAAGVTTVRLAFMYDDGVAGSDALIAQVGGTSIVVGAPAATTAAPIPTLSPLAMAVLLLLVGVIAFLVLRHGGAKGAGTAAIVLLAFIATIASAAIVLDGLTADWAGTAPVNDTIGDAAAGADISAAFARIEGSTLFVRVDVKTAMPPSAVADSLTATAGTPLTVAAAAGLLSNDTLGTPAATLSSYGGGSLGGAVTDHAAGTTTVVGTGGSLVVQADGSLTFTPPTGFSSSFTFDYRLANAYGFSVGTVTIGARVAPAITSATSTTFVLGNASSFTVTATGTPTPTLALTSGALPSGITFNAATGVLSGTPGAGTSGTYPLTFTASNGVNPNAVQAFTLTVNQGAAITSANAATFTVGTAGTFTVTTSASPSAGTITATGALPGGVTFTNNGDGTATIGGTPGAGTGGTYPVTITASNGVGSPGSQSFTLTVNQAPAITSANAATFTVGNASSFTVTDTGFPSPTLSLGGPLPSGVNFNAATGVLSGTPAAGTGGSYPLTITAANGVGTNATQSFTLTVNQGVLITSANAASFSAGALGSFSITTSGTPFAGTIAETGALPSGILFVNNGDGTATLSGTPAAGTGGLYPIVISASNGVGSPGLQSFTLTVLQAPAITSTNAATFLAGSAGTFTLTTSGYPASGFAQTGALPTGVTFTSNGDGTATLAGTPASGTGGTYPLSISASNGVGAPALQAFTLVVQQAPGAVADVYTVAHDAVLPGSSILANDTGVPPPALTSVTGSGPACTVFPCAIATTHGNAGVNADGTFTYTPAAAFAGTDGFGYAISNAAGTSSSTVTITVTDAAPVVDLNGTTAPGIDFGPATFVEAAGAVAIVDPALLTVTDADSTTLASATIVLTNALDGASESLNLTCPDVAPGCSGAIQLADVVSTTNAGPPATATITITRVAPLADYQALLRTLTYANAAANPSNTDRDVTVTLNDGIVDSAPVAHTTVVVNGVNDAPTITAPANVTTPVNTAYAFAGSVSVADPDAGTANVRVDLTATNGTLTLTGAAGLTITGNGTGSVSATGPLSSQNSALAGMQFTPTASFNGTASVGITIDDLGNTGSGGPKTASRAISIAVNQAPSITSANATTFVLGSAGTFTVTTSGIPAVITVTEAGSLPIGVAFLDNGNGTATISGTPGSGSQGSYPVTITAFNGFSNVQQAFTLTVNAAPTITSANAATFAVGTAGSFGVGTTGFPSPTVSVTAGTLPSGVTLNGTTGLLSGTPAAGTAGTYPLTLKAANGVNPDATQAFSLTVNEAPSITSSANVNFTVGVAATFSVTTTGTPASMIINLTGSLPLGMAFTDNGNGTATISGTPGVGSLGSYPVTITASNGVNPQATQTLFITVLQLPAFTSANSTTFSVGVPGTFTVSTTAFPAASITRTGTLPTGVTFTDNGNGTGTLAGTPASGTAASSPYAEIFTATNGAGSVPQNFSLAICPVIGATPASLATPTRTNAYTTTLGGSGGTGPYTFTVASGALPTGLSLAANGVLSGTVNGAGTFNFTVGVTDASGCAGSTAYSVLVNEPPVGGTDNFDVVGNTLLEVAAVSSAATPKIYASGNVLANDNDGNGGANGVGVSLASVGTFATANGGSIALAADGSFTYVPPAGFSGTDTFLYSVSDGLGTGTGTINLNVLPQRVWYVQNNGPAGNGTSTSPFNTLAAGVSASAANDTIYVFTGDGTSANQNAGAVLKANQRLIGQGAALDVPATVNGVANPVLQAAGTSPIIGNTSGNGVTLASSNTVKGLDIANGSSGAGLFGSNVVNLVVSGVNINSSGAGVDLTGTGAPIVNVVLGNLSSSGGAHNVNLASLGGTVNLGTGTLSGAGGNAFAVTGSSANISYAGTITNNIAGASVVQVANETGGTVAFSGAISSGATVGNVFLIGNTGATIDFSGGLSLSSGASTAFTATGGGTVTVEQNNTSIVNTLTSTGGTALKVVNTTIGGAGLTFRSISANLGSTAGIILDTTGTSGGLTVTGDGTNTSVGGNSSGGVIANVSGPDLSNTQGTGIYLNSTKNVVLRRMTINGTNTNYGIHGYNVNGFTLEYSTVAGTEGDKGSLAAPENYGEGAIYFGNSTTTGLLGAGTFTSNSISGGRARNLSIVNSSGVAVLTLKANTFGQVQNFSDANENVAVEARGSANITATLGDSVGGANTIAGSPGDQVNFTGQASTTMTVTAAGNTLTNTHPQNLIGGSGVTLATQGTMNFTLQNNTMNGANGDAVALQTGGTGVLSGKVDNNRIGTNGLTDSGSKTGNGIFGSFAGIGSASLTITNNLVFSYSGNAGMYFDNTGGSYAANFTIKNNTVGTPGPGAFAGLAISNGGSGSGDTVNVCADIKSNNFSAGDPLNFNDIFVSASGAAPAPSHEFNLPGYVGTTLGQVQTFIQNNNVLPGSTTVVANVDFPNTAAGFTGVGISCPTPP